jgi:hypothetical protein
MGRRGDMKQSRWKCPTCGHGLLAPTRPRRNDVRRYCLPCSSKAGVLVERVAPALDAQRAARDVARRERERKARERERDRKQRANNAPLEGCATSKWSTVGEYGMNDRTRNGAPLETPCEDATDDVEGIDERSVASLTTNHRRLCCSRKVGVSTSNSEYGTRARCLGRHINRDSSKSRRTCHGKRWHMRSSIALGIADTTARSITR